MRTTRLFSLVAVVAALTIAPYYSAAWAQTVPSGNTYAVLVGLSQYSDHTLPRTDEDAARLGRALTGAVPQSQLHMQVILNSEATRARVLEALGQVAAQATAQDTVVFFYSGHGSQLPMNGWTQDEPDGFQETLSLFDGQMLDDELSTALDAIQSRLTLVALDSCFSGGFLYDVVDRPGRMGLFSSDEDLTSGMPSDAGGHLAKFLAQAIEGQADGSANAAQQQGRDGLLTALEIETFVRDSWTQIAHSPASDSSSSRVGFQFVDIKRAGVQPAAVVIPVGQGSGAVSPHPGPTPSPTPSPNPGPGRVMVEQTNVQLPGSMDFAARPALGDYPFQAGRTYIIETFNLAPGCDTVIELRRSSNPQAAVASDPIVARNDDSQPGQTLASRIQWTADQTGPYYISVSPYDLSSGGSFSIRVTEIGAP